MFVLSEDTQFQVETEEWARNAGVKHAVNPQVFWQIGTHTQPPRLGLTILAGSQTVFDPVRVGENETGFFTCGAALPGISDDGLEIGVTFRPQGADRNGEIALARKAVARWDLANPWEEIELDLSPCRGKTGSFRVSCGAGPSGDPSADWAAIYEFVAAAPEQRTLLRARAFPEWRLKNELAHFNAAQTPEYLATRARGWLSGLPWLPDWLGGNPPLSPPSPARYAREVLQKNLGKPIPDFTGLLQKRIRSLKAGEKVRVLALCSGTAQKEAVLLGHVNATRVDLTLMDFNAELLERAKTRLSTYCETRVVACNLNSINLHGETFDIILCAAGLHHLVELEHVAAAIARSLRPGGEFWAISEYIGRPGARLWPDAYAVANPFFQALPEKYRVSSLSGEPDTELPNVDCSVSTFEGIRAPEIEGILERWLRPAYVSKQACWLWRVMDSAYGKNYNLESRQDRAIIHKAAALDADFQRRGGKPSGLNAIYTVRD